ncbi:MAG: transcription-repair coupling factor [Pseudomonadota bacterium]
MTPAALLAGVSGQQTIAGAPFGADVLALVQMLQGEQGSAVYVARDDKQAVTALKIAEYADPGLDRIHLPAWDTLPYDRVSPSPAVAARRCAALARLSRLAEFQKPTLIVTTAASVVQRVPTAELMRAASFSVSVGEPVAQQALTEYLSVNGYVRVSTVRERGEYAVRGGIIDIFAPTSPEPLRLDFFGDFLEGLRSFDAETQRSTAQLQGAAFAPVSEILFNDEVLSRFRERYLETFGPPSGDPMYEAARASIRRQGVETWLPLFHERLDTLFEYVPESTLITFGHLAGESANERLSQAQDYFDARVEAAGDHRAGRVLDPGALYLDAAEFEARIQSRRVARFTGGDAAVNQSDLGASQGRNFAPERAKVEENVFEAAGAHAKALRAQGKSVILAAWSDGSADRLVNVFEDHGLAELERSYSLPAAQTLGLAVSELPLESGFILGDTAIIAEPDILGDRLAAPRRKRKAANFIAEAAALAVGDLVVHVDHGVARYSGLKTLDLTGAPHDCLELEYAGGDRIFLPVENIDLISRFGSDDAAGAIDRLGGAGWQARKAKAKKRILEMAAELMEVAAQRLLKKGEVVDAGDGLYEEFAAGFPFAETDDQLHAIEDVLGDLSSGRPMDRLVCGDVGFGKTEVALRGAFVAAMTGMQVAIIAPTTILARQHFNTFSDRLGGWPLEVRQLSRLVSAKDATETRAGIRSGSVNVVIGTHALLAKTVEFNNLGLMIVDEEQRFGVKHKERLKELRADVHVLTLSATPIPRTLQMALTGIRDLSIIATPPVDRLSVRTYVTEFDTVTIREALLREKYRGGQAFFVAPRIKDLARLEDFLKDNVPEVRFVVAHGQMAAGELDDIMTAFYEGEYDVLLSTTIVESGLDIPRANTLIIYRADRFGLAQLYQLRGRVGRSKQRAYAYFTTPRDEVITETADKRLRVLQSLDSLGAGFQLASHDLDMRGSGNLLGDQQSGHVKEVGVELYQQMLEDAVAALQSGQGPEVDTLADEWSPTINLGLAVLIPEDYVDDLAVRMSLYRRLADIDTHDGRESFAAELVDRFGPLPEPTQQLLDVAAIKARCKALGIQKVDAGPKGAVFSFREETTIDPGLLMTVVQARPSQLKLRPDSKLVLTSGAGSPVQRIGAIQRLLDELAEAVPGN